jgi:nitrate/nitrite transporter NarK
MDVQTRTMRKVATRLIPALLVLYVIAYLDRVNVTFAQDKLSEVGRGFVTAIPYAVAIVGMVVIPRNSDRTGERKLRVSVCLLGGAAAAAGIAMINSLGNLGGFAGPYFAGLLKDATGSTDGGLIGLAAILVAGAFVATRVAHDRASERDPLERTGRFTRDATRVPHTVR